MLEDLLRPRFQKWLIDPFLRIQAIKKASPLLITGLGTGLGIGALPSIMFGHPFLAIILLALSGYCDTLDGTLARQSGKASSLGAVCDIFSDRVVELAVILGLFFYGPEQRAMGSILMLGSIYLCITSFLVVGMVSTKTSEKSFYYSPGLIERAEAFLMWGAMILFPNFFFPLAGLFTALVALTTGIRLVQFFRQASMGC